MPPTHYGKFDPLQLKGKTLLPIVQGGMGVCISAHRLAGAVAAENAVGTIASVDLRHHHPDLVAKTEGLRDKALIKEIVNDVNLIALDREIRAARVLSQGQGLVAVNVMRAVSEYRAYVRQSCESGADAIVMGAGLPLDLPDLASDYPDVALIPILSDIRGVVIILKRWMKKGRLPDAIVIEHPKHAGGHLGAFNKEDVNSARFEFAEVIPGVLEQFKEMGLESERIPLIPAGGINSHEKMKEMIDLGASAVQIGTAFAVTEEGDAHINFKKTLAGAVKEQIVEFMSCAGLPARAVLTPWLQKYLKREEKLMESANSQHKCLAGWECLLQCGLRDGIAKFGQFCIDNQLAAAVRGEIDKGLFFRGSEMLPFGQAIRPVRDLIRYMLTGERQMAAAA